MPKHTLYAYCVLCETFHLYAFSSNVFTIIKYLASCFGMTGSKCARCINQYWIVQILFDAATLFQSAYSSRLVCHCDKPSAVPYFSENHADVCGPILADTIPIFETSWNTKKDYLEVFFLLRMYLMVRLLPSLQSMPLANGCTNYWIRSNNSRSSYLTAWIYGIWVG